MRKSKKLTYDEMRRFEMNFGGNEKFRDCYMAS